MRKIKFSIVFSNGLKLCISDRGFTLWNGTKGGYQWVIDASCLTDDDRFELGQNTTKCESKIGNRVYKAVRQIV